MRNFHLLQLLLASTTMRSSVGATPSDSLAEQQLPTNARGSMPVKCVVGDDDFAVIKLYGHTHDQHAAVDEHPASMHAERWYSSLAPNDAGTGNSPAELVVRILLAATAMVAGSVVSSVVAWRGAAAHALGAFSGRWGILVAGLFFLSGAQGSCMCPSNYPTCGSSGNFLCGSCCWDGNLYDSDNTERRLES